MKKYLVQIEFRYTDKKPDRNDEDFVSRMLTIGVYDDLEEAIEKGNEKIQVLENRFPIHKFPDGREAVRERFSKNGGCFGSMKNLMTDMAYLKTPFSFFAKITTLKFDDLEEAINEAVEARKRYVKFKTQEDGNE